MKAVLYTRVYKRVRRSHGRLVARYRGYFTLEKGGIRHWRELGTPDRTIAEKRIMEMALAAQREREGLTAPREERETAAKPLTKLIDEYEKDLLAQSLRKKHVHDTITRICRIVKETGWRSIGEVRPEGFTAWRSGLKASPKTVLEYQVSLNAFLNWLCDMDRIPTNPLRKVREVETKGQQVRPYRAFTPEELRQLLSVAGKHRLAYLTLLYTAQRKSEVRALVWGDLHLDGQRPYILFRDETTKDKKKRAVALRRELARLLLAARPDGVDPTKKVFWAMWPTYDILMGHLRKAGIARKDGMGRVVHFHSFRKTWQTLGVRSGVNQRAAQEILGHTDANLTAQAYTDVPALGMDDEVAKLPWVGDENSLAHRGAHFSAFSRPAPSLADICSEFIKVVKVHGTEEISHALASAVTPPHFDQLAARAGIEPVTK